MTVKYKVWVQVERIDEAADVYEDVGLPDSLGTFRSLKQAAAFVRTLPGWARFGSTSDYREKVQR